MTKNDPQTTKSKYIRNDLGSIVGHLIEECGEVLAAAGKSIRWGLASYNPEIAVEDREDNLAWLRREISDLKAVINRFEKRMEYFDERKDIAALEIELRSWPHV